MKRWIAACAVAVLLGAPAYAKWETEIDEDPMTDEKIAYMEAGEDDDGDVALALKCWDDKDKSISLYIFTDVKYDKAAKYPDHEVFSFRIDKGEIFTLPLQPVDLDGILTYELAVSAQPRVAARIKAVGAAKERVAVESSSRQMVFEAKGSGDAFDIFTKTCKLDLSS
jgi:hypothetical protein